MISAKISRAALFPMLGAMALAFVTPASAQQDFPSQPIRFITGFPPGSGADLFTRFVAERMKEVSGAQINVENRAGATGAIALEHVARSKPDGYTILLTAGSATAAQNHLYKEQRVNVLESLRMVGSITRFGFMIGVDPKSPYKTLQDLTAALKQKGESANYGTSNTSGIALAELYKTFAGGLKTTQVKYKGTPDSLRELNGGSLDFITFDPGFGLPQVKQGRLRALAVSTPQRISSIPDVPTMEEGGVKGIDLTVWWALIVPKATPDAPVNKLNGWLKTALEMPQSKKFFEDAGGEIYITTPAQADAHFQRDEKNWAEYLRIAGIEKQ
jgi:tripartite-type tricarboxylate transporter receptor subunit TctC